MRVSGRALIVGSGRSGTTLLQALVGSHPEVVTFPETQFGEATVGEYERRLFGRNVKSARHPVIYLLARLRAGLGLAAPRARDRWASTANELRLAAPRTLPLGGVFIRPNLAAFVGLFDDAARAADAKVWVEKSPNHVHYLPELFDAAPDLRVLHVVRDGLEVVASMARAAEQYPDSWWARLTIPDDAVRLWNRALETTLEVGGDPNHHVVRYETLAREPGACMREVFKFLGLPHYPEALTEYRDQVGLIVTAREPWKGGTASAITRPGPGRFDRIFSEPERKRITDALLYGGSPPSWLGRTQW